MSRGAKRPRAVTLAPKPCQPRPSKQSAASPSACTALQTLRDAGEITAGQQVLIIGASGGVGLFAVQIAKAYGAEVTGVCSTGKVELVRSVGADHVIDYTEDDVTTSGQQYDLILDMGGNRTLSELRRCLTSRGTLVLVGGEGGGRLVGGALRRSLRALALSPFVHQNLKMVLGTTKSGDLETLTDLIGDSALAPVLDRAMAWRGSRGSPALHTAALGKLSSPSLLTRLTAL